MLFISKRNTLGIPLLLAILLVAFLLTNCPENKPDDSTGSNQNQTVKNEISNSISAELNPGTFKIDTVEDGDTIRLVGVRKSIRLLCVDTEEVFSNKKKTDKKLAYEDWQAYLKIHHNADELEKYPTPLGDEAEKFVVDFFEDYDEVIIEHDTLNRLTGYFDRHLCYVIVEINGERINFNVELVRLGYTPYYTKYGYSLRYHDDFIAAENEAKQNNLGVWNDTVSHYPDYPERIKLWNSRAQSIKSFVESRADKENHFVLLDDTDWNRLNEYVGKEITVLGSIDQTRKKGPPFRFFMDHKHGRSVMFYTENESLFRKIIENFDNQSIFSITGILEQDDKYKMQISSFDQINFELITSTEIDNTTDTGLTANIER
ncbi:thermonuclease family protein [bacterium]|nr:thermonuclease family protein [bacterium]MBU1024477.1 thermonuclease family protein [bacterium]